MTHTPTSTARPEDASSAQTETPLANSDAPAPDGYDSPEYYDPQEYRWVPVRRRPRHDGWTEEKQRRFIEALADTGLVSHAAKSVGMSRESATASAVRRMARPFRGHGMRPGNMQAARWKILRLNAPSKASNIMYMMNVAK